MRISLLRLFCALIVLVIGPAAEASVHVAVKKENGDIVTLPNSGNTGPLTIAYGDPINLTTAQLAATIGDRNPWIVWVYDENSTDTIPAYNSGRDLGAITITVSSGFTPPQYFAIHLLCPSLGS